MQRSADLPKQKDGRMSNLKKMKEKETLEYDVIRKESWNVDEVEVVTYDEEEKEGRHQGRELDGVGTGGRWIMLGDV